MTAPSEVEGVLWEALGFLEREGVPFAVMGGLAVALWGIPRATFDIDLELDLPREKLPDFLQAAERAGFIVEDAHASGFVEDVHGLPLVPIKLWAGGRAVVIDLFLVEGPFLREAFQRSVEVDLGGRARRVVTPADLVLFKLLAWRAKDRWDIENLLTVQGVPEEAYLRAWAARLGVLERLEETLERWGDGPRA